MANSHQQRLWCGPYLILCVVTRLVDSGEDQPSLCPPQQCIKPSVGGFGFLEGQRPIWRGQKGQKARRPPAIHDAPFHNFLRTKLPHIIISRRAAVCVCEEWPVCHKHWTSWWVRKLYRFEDTVDIFVCCTQYSVLG